jgi:hypothetical protein
MCDGAEVVHGRGWRAVEGGGGAEGARWKAAAAARECGERRSGKCACADDGGATGAGTRRRTDGEQRRRTDGERRRMATV